MSKVKIRNTRHKALTIVLDPAIYKGGAVFTDPRTGGPVPGSVTVRAGCESVPLDRSVRDLPQVKALRKSGALRILAPVRPAKSKPASKRKSKKATQPK